MDRLKNKQYIEIPNFFKNSGRLYNKIGERHAFVLYLLLISRQNILGDVYTSISEILYYIKIGENKSRDRKRILEYLNNLRSYKLIDFNFDADDISNNTFFEIRCINIIEDNYHKDLVKFYDNDFKIYEKIGSIPYCVMWVLRMLKDEDTNITKISIYEISKLLKCKNSTVNNAINIFNYIKLFDIVGRYSYYDGLYKKKNSDTNEYKYLGDFSILKTISHEEAKILFIDGLPKDIKIKNYQIDIYKEGEDCSDKYGVYFIYDNKNDIAYIGKSSVCIVKRSLQSAEERNLYNFTKIELKPTKTQSDIDIYEKYYIQKYKPFANNDGIYQDHSTIELPDIKTKQIIYNRN